MNELLAIIKDVKSGTLPRSEILGFIGFMLRKVAWISIAVSFAGIFVVVMVAVAK
jgi:hypothetical protein